MSSLTDISKILARSFVLSGMEEEVLIKQASELYFGGTKPRWLRPLARHVVEEFSEAGSRPLLVDVVSSIKNCRSFYRAFEKGKVELKPDGHRLVSQMCAAEGRPQKWLVPEVTNLGDLANLLEIHIDDLGWLTSQHGNTDHYHIRWHKKRGTRKARVIEIPKPLLKQTQRMILTRILEQIPVHENACGFCAGKSVIDFVEPHSESSMVLKMDFRDYFPSISSGRVMRFFMTAGYPEAVSGALTDLCTHSLNPELFAGSNLEIGTKRNLEKKHLPQGAPTSPALANLCSFRLDCRLAGLAKAAGAQYTRYADDLLFSGGEKFRRFREGFHIKVLSIAIEEGFRIHTRKTRFMGQSGRQFAAGLVMNQKPNVSRQQFDQLKAILTNSVRHGWRSQNRDNHSDFRAHLEGRIGWVRQSNPNRAEKLDRLLAAVKWDG